MLISYPGMSSVDLYKGYDHFRAEVMGGNPFDADTVPDVSVEAIPGQSDDFYAELIEDSASVRDKLDISAQAEFGIGAFSGSASASFSKSLQMDSYNLYIVGKVTSRLEKIGLSGRQASRLRLSSDVVKTLDSPDDLARFRRKYGDMFVSGLIRGGALLFVVQIETNSRGEKQQIAASIGGGGASWSFKADFKNEMESLTKHRRVTACITQSGGRWGFKEVDAASLMDAAFAFPTTVRDAPVTVAVEVSEYDSLQNWPESVGDYLPISQVNRRLRALHELHSRFAELRHDVDYVAANAIAFRQYDPAVLAQVRKAAEDAKRQLRQGIEDLVDSPLESVRAAEQLLALDPEPERARLPQWREKLPRSARDILREHPDAADGDYDIWLGGDGHKRVRLLCRMRPEPREYVRLVQPNSSMVKADDIKGQYPGYNGSDVVTTWSHVRIDPETLDVTLDDYDGARTTGGPAGVYKVAPFGTASQCGGTDRPSGVAKIDFTGTQFKFHPDVKIGDVGSWEGWGQVNAQTDRSATFEAKGRCGGWGPAMAGRLALRLEFDPRAPLPEPWAA